MAARFRIIVLDKPQDDTPNLYRLAFWADVPAARQTFYANAGATSAWKDATAGDLTALQNGSVVEKTVFITVPAGWTLNQIEAEAQSQWTAYQAFITARNPWVRYGSTWDGSSWVLGGVS